MLKKILKYTFRTLLVILLVLILVPALLYIPAVQDFVRSKAVGYASRTLGMDLSVERLRLSFPLRLSVDNTLLTDKGDTLLSCGHLSLEVAVWPLLRKEVAVRSLELAKLAAHYGDSTAGMDLKVAAGQFAVNDCRVGLPAKTVGISRIALTDGDVFLNTAESAPAEKADSAAALPWQIDVGKLTVANLVFGMRTAPAVTDLSVRLPDGEVDSCRVLLDSRQVSVKSILLNRGVPFIATNPDWVCPTWYGSVPDCGSVCRMLTTATGREPTFIGKPQPEMARLAMERTGFSPEQTVLLGDRLYTDIACGVNAGIDTVFVLSGEGTQADIAAYQIHPTWVYPNIGTLYRELEETV